MAKRFGFFNSINGDRKYLATDLSQAFNVGISTGLKADNADNFKIVPNANMQVKMMPGGAMIFGHYLLDEEEELINLDVSHAELNRIDRIVLRYDEFERSIKTAVIKGIPALTPVAPAVLRTNEQFDLVLADIYVGKAVTAITTANITDMRKSELCGFIGVKGTVSQIDFDSYSENVANQITGLSNRRTVLVGRETNIEGQQTIHLGFKPCLVRIYTVLAAANCANYESTGSYDGTSVICLYKYGDGIAAPSFTDINIVQLHSGNASNSADISITDTGIILNWTVYNNIPAGTIQMLVEVI